MVPSGTGLLCGSLRAIAILPRVKTTTTTLPVIAVIQLTDSFRQIWAEIAASAGATPLFMDCASLDESRAAVVVIAAGGMESQAFHSLRDARQSQPGVPVAVVGALHDHRVALALVKAGADEYFALPGDIDELSRWLEHELQRSTARATSGDFGCDY